MHENIRLSIDVNTNKDRNVKYSNMGNIIPFVNQSLTVQSTHPHYLKFCTFKLLLPITCFGHSFDHHQVEIC